MASKTLKKFFSLTGRILEECGKGVVAKVKKDSETNFRTERQILSNIASFAAIVIAPPGSFTPDATTQDATVPDPTPAPETEPGTAATPSQDLANSPDLLAALHDELESNSPQSYAQLQKALARLNALPPVTMADVHVILMAHPELFEPLEDGTYRNRKTATNIHENGVCREISESRRAFLENEIQRTLVRIAAIQDQATPNEVHQYQLLLDYQRNITEERKGASLQAQTPAMRQKIEAFWAERQDPAVCFPSEATIAFLRLYPPADAPLQRFASLDLDFDEDRESKESSHREADADVDHDSNATSTRQSHDAESVPETSVLQLAWFSCQNLDAFQRATATEKLFFLLQSVGEPVPYCDLATMTAQLEISEKSLRRILNTSSALFQSMPEDCWTTPFAAAAFARRNGIVPDDDE